MDLSQHTDEELRLRTESVVRNVVTTLDAEVPVWLAADQLVKEVVDEAIGLGPLEDLLADPTIDEIMVNSWDRIYVERKGKIELTDKCFTDNNQVIHIIRRIVAPLGRRVDESSPMVDARLKDGSRVNAIIAPLALTGPTLTIRKFAADPFTEQDLIGFGTLTQQIVDFLRLGVRFRSNMVISGGTGTGKTTLLNVVSAFIPGDERIVTIEDAAELKLHQEHVVSLEAKPANIEGKGAIPIRELVRNTLRMRPDRIIIGECRSGEALDMLQAMNTGHDGSLTTIHANSERDTLSRIETMVLMAGMDLPSRAIREQIASAIDFVVQISRMTDGTRKVTGISEITGMEGETITMQPIYKFEQKGFGAGGKVLGSIVPTGAIPKFIHDLRARGISVDLTLFQDNTAPPPPPPHQPHPAHR
jgi:pilus assembly protein CpaF